MQTGILPPEILDSDNNYHKWAGVDVFMICRCLDIHSKWDQFVQLFKNAQRISKFFSPPHRSNKYEWLRSAGPDRLLLPALSWCRKQQRPSSRTQPRPVSPPSPLISPAPGARAARPAPAFPAAPVSLPPRSHSTELLHNRCEHNGPFSVCFFFQLPNTIKGTNGYHLIVESRIGVETFHPTGICLHRLLAFIFYPSLCKISACITGY